MDKLGVGKLVDLAGSVITGVMGGLEQLFGPALQNGLDIITNMGSLDTWVGAFQNAGGMLTDIMPVEVLWNT